ncbi:hypothetical protein JCGZ_15156 [Jatropha curcas]|uniref:Uncharacterized protein n=1 Tax=Jatropha curcas TaxID=180498 RepID=A0A067LA16_JATCU|nr:hypothetical protein JCGZ_15156 [Jatropha curcas]
MGGDSITSLTSTPEEEFSMNQDVLRPLSSNNPYYHSRDDISGNFEDKTFNEDYELVFGGFEQISSSSLEFEANIRKRCNAYNEVFQSYHQLQSRTKGLEEAKRKILSYTPGEWIEKAGGMSDYNVPKTTTLLLVGPKGSGKSSLINRISKVFEDDKFAPERAQVSYNSSAVEGTYFLQEYMIPRGSASFCLYDSRGLSDDFSENVEMLKQWITKGVRHGELIIRPSDHSSLKTRIKCKVRGNGSQSSETRMVNFVIFVVNGLAVLKSMESEGDEGSLYWQMIAKTFNCPYLSFKDDKPAVVVTHSDLLSLSDRARIRVWLGNLLGIPPAKQIFDIPESFYPVTELTIVDMLRYSLEHAEKNLPRKDWLAEKVRGVKVSLLTCIYLFIILGIVIISIKMQYKRIRHEPRSKVQINWHAIRHLWLDLD